MLISMHHRNGEHDDGVADVAFGEVALRAAQAFAHEAPELPERTRTMRDDEAPLP